MPLKPTSSPTVVRDSSKGKKKLPRTANPKRPALAKNALGKSALGKSALGKSALGKSAPAKKAMGIVNPTPLSHSPAEVDSDPARVRYERYDSVFQEHRIPFDIRPKFVEFIEEAKADSEFMLQLDSNPAWLAALGEMSDLYTAVVIDILRPLRVAWTARSVDG